MMKQLISSFRKTYRQLPNRPFRRQLAALYYAYLNVAGRRIQANVGGINYDLDLYELIDSTIYFEGVWEPETTKVIRKLASKGLTAIDVGANMGYYTLLMAQAIGAGGMVIAFEPMTPAYARLQRNHRLNNLNNVVLERKALSDFNGERLVVFPTSWRLDLQQKPLPPETVAYTTLDSYILSHSALLRHVDLIKLDVDGNEYSVLAGAIATIKQFTPRIILEVNVDSIDVLDLLKTLGYRFSSIGSLQEYDTPEELLRCLPTEPGKTVNVVASTNPEALLTN